MSVVDPTRERRKFVNPKFPLGSTWGPRGDGPLCGPGCINSANDPEVAMDAEYLSDADMRDIVRRAQAFLQHHGPCRDEDLWGLVDPWQARLVRSSFGSLAAYLAKQPGFHWQRRGEHALLCYWGPEKEGGHFPQSTSSSCLHHPLSSGHPGGFFPKGGLAEGKRGRRGSRSGSSSTSSYKSALEDLDGEEKGERAEQKKPRRQRPPSGTTSTCYDTKGIQTVFTVRDGEVQTDEPDNTPEESEAQIVKIVKLLKKRMPQFTEAEIRRHVDEVRILHGGFSRMVIRNIVALVMEHMCNVADAPGNEET